MLFGLATGHFPQVCNRFEFASKVTITSLHNMSISEAKRGKHIPHPPHLVEIFLDFTEFSENLVKRNWGVPDYVVTPGVQVVL